MHSILNFLTLKIDGRVITKKRIGHARPFLTLRIEFLTLISVWAKN